MSRRESKADLADLVRAALRSADTLGEWEAGAHLDQALIALVGTGAEPFQAAPSGGVERNSS